MAQPGVEWSFVGYVLAYGFATLGCGIALYRASRVEFREAVESAWERTTPDDVSLTVEGGGTVEADESRLETLFESAFSFAARNGASRVTVSLREDGFAVADDGEPPGGDTDAFFEYGDAVPTPEAGMALPTVRTLARVHGWEATIDDEYREGVRLVVSGAEVRRGPTETA